MLFVNLLETTVYKKIYVFINPGKYLPLWKDETTLLKLHAQLTYKQNEKKNIINKLCSSVVLFTLCSLNFIMEINKPQTTKEQGQQFSWFIFLKKGKANNKSVTLSLAAPAFITMPTN